MTAEKIPNGACLKPWRSVYALADSLNDGAQHPTFSIPSLRNLLAVRDQNGLDRFVRKVGGKLLVSEPGFNFWIEQQGKPCDSDELSK